MFIPCFIEIRELVLLGVANEGRSRKIKLLLAQNSIPVMWHSFTGRKYCDPLIHVTAQYAMKFSLSYKKQKQFI